LPRTARSNRSTETTHPDRTGREGALGGEAGDDYREEHQGRARISRSAAAARSCGPGEGSGGAPPGRIGAAVAAISCGGFEREEAACGRREMSGAEGEEEERGEVGSL